MRRNSKARLRLPPNSAYMMSLRMRSPSKAEPYDTGIGTLAILTLTPRTSMQRWMSFSVRSMSSAPGISSNGMLTTCSYWVTPVGRICGMRVSAMTGKP